MERTISGYVPCIALPCSLARDNMHQIKDELIKRTKIVTDGDSPEKDNEFSQQFEVAWVTVSTESDRSTMMHCVLAKPKIMKLSSSAYINSNNLRINNTTP